MPLAILAQALNALVSTINDAMVVIAAESGTMDTALGILKDDTALIKAEFLTLDVAIGTLKDDIALIKADVGTIDDNIASALNKMVEGAPTGGTPWSATNLIANYADTDTVGEAVKAAPGAGYRLCINELHFQNTTAAEVAVLYAQDEDDVVLAGPFSVGDPAVSGKGYLRVVFSQPIKLSENKALEVAPVGSVGDSLMLALGYTEAMP